MAEIIVVNVVASASIGKELMLQDIAFQLEGAEYDQDRFPGLIYKLAEPKTAVLIFQEVVKWFAQVQGQFPMFMLQ